MPFKSKAQHRLCRELHSEDWDCSKMYLHTKTPYQKLPEYVQHTGPRGGIYIIKKGRKVYI